jgi:hypothetical protein
MVLLDQEPLRKKAALDCSREMARLEKLRADYQRYEKKDRPLFDRWMAQTFGALISALREGVSSLREKEGLIAEVNLMVIFGNARSHRAAYKMVLERRAAPPEEAGEDEDWEDDYDDFGSAENVHGGARDSAQERMLFEEFLELNFGVYPEDLTKAEYADLLARFKKEVLEEPPSPKERAANTRAKAPPPEKQGAERLKEIYRQLVRRLHPDTRKDSSPSATALWHEVQDAYATGNLERLETIFALSEMTEQTFSATTTLFQMHSALRELKRSSQAVLRTLSAAKKDPAWGFAELQEHAALQAKVEKQLLRDRAAQLFALAEVEALLASWEKTAKTRKPPARKAAPKAPGSRAKSARRERNL